MDSSSADSEFKYALSDLYYSAQRVYNKYGRKDWVEWTNLGEDLQRIDDLKHNGQLVIAPEYFGD